MKTTGLFLVLITSVVTLLGCAASNVKTTTTTADLAQKQKAILVFSLSQTYGSESIGTAQYMFQTTKTNVMTGDVVTQTYDPALAFSKPKSDFKEHYGLLKVIEVPAGKVDLTRWQFSMGIYICTPLVV